MAINQFDKDYRETVSDINFVVARPAGASRARSIAQVVADSGGKCVCYNTRHSFNFRVSGRITQIPWRAFAYYATRGTLPRHGFGPTTCGTRGCIHPDHQTDASDRDFRDMFSVVDPAANTAHSIRPSFVGVAHV